MQAIAIYQFISGQAKYFQIRLFFMQKDDFNDR